MKKGNLMPSYYPVFLNINDKKCVVVGGGQVALRKTMALLEHRASVEVISPDICPELARLAKGGKIRVQRRGYQAGDLRDAIISIAATDDSEINRQVVDEARKGAVLINVVDDADNSDFILPSYLRRGDITIAISTAGRSPALARKIRTRLEKEFGDEYASLALLLDEVRAEVKRRGVKLNGDIWQEAIDPDMLISLLQSDDREKARTILLDNLGIEQK